MMRNMCTNDPVADRRLPRLTLLAAAATAVLSACGSPPAEPGLRFAVARFQHETCTFCPGGDTEVEDWLRQSEPVSGDALLGGGGYVGGFVQRAREFGDVEFVPLTSPVGVFGGSSRSWNTKETFDHFLGAMLAELEQQLPVDGVYLALHGAMAVRDVPRPEAEIARRFRELVGPDVPIAGTFDLHGNEDAEFLEHADFAFVTKRFPTTTPTFRANARPAPCGSPRGASTNPRARPGSPGSSPPPCCSGPASPPRWTSWSGRGAGRPARTTPT